MKQKTLLTIDGDGLLARAHHGAGHDRLMGTQKVGGIYNAINKIRWMISTWDADAFQIAFDPFEPTTFRHKEYAAYKAGRPPKEEDLVKAKVLLIEIMKNMGATVIMNPEYEADDLVATGAVQAVDAGWRAVVGSKDKDMLALLVHDGIIIQPPYASERFDKAALEARYKVSPSQMDDFLAMWGDSVDNIPGITGCGEKRAGQLLLKYHSLEGAIAAANKGDVGGELGKNLIAEGNRALAFRAFLKLRTNIEGVPTPEQSGFGVPNYAALFQTFSKLGFHDLANEARSNMSNNMDSPSP